VTADQAQKTIGRVTKLVYTKWVKDPKATTGPHPGYKPAFTGLTGDDIASASAAIDQNSTSWVVNISFNSNGAAVFDRLTTANVAACASPDPTTGQFCAERFLTIWLDLTQADIDKWDDPAYQAKLLVPYNAGCLPSEKVVCGKLLVDPVTQQEIAGGNAQISGNFTQQSANDLATGINAGSLPVDLQVLAVTQVGSTLGAESVKLSLAAGLLGLSIVIVFMIVYYRIPGLLASIALLFYAGAVLAVFKVVPVTLTLAGITGFILSVGMAVDANVLIFERFKEEVRSGRTIPAAVDAAVRRAWPAIRDSNTSTFITCVILGFVGPTQVKGSCHHACHRRHCQPGLLDRRDPQPAGDSPERKQPAAAWTPRGRSCSNRLTRSRPHRQRQSRKRSASSRPGSRSLRSPAPSPVYERSISSSAATCSS